MQAQILTPAAVLVIWSIVMLFWMAFTRLPALSKLGGLGKAKLGGRGQDLEGVLPDEINWKAHNYTHLMEQPTLFDVYRHHAFFTTTDKHAMDTVVADKTHRAHAIIEQVHADLKAGPLAHLPSGAP